MCYLFNKSLKKRGKQNTRRLQTVKHFNILNKNVKKKKWVKLKKQFKYFKCVAVFISHTCKSLSSAVSEENFSWNLKCFESSLKVCFSQAMRQLLFFIYMLDLLFKLKILLCGISVCVIPEPNSVLNSGPKLLFFFCFGFCLIQKATPAGLKSFDCPFNTNPSRHYLNNSISSIFTKVFSAKEAFIVSSQQKMFIENN